MEILLQIIMLSSVRLLTRLFRIISKTNFRQILNPTIKTIYKLLKIKNLITSIHLCILIKKIYNKIIFCILIKMRKIKIFLKCKTNIRINLMLKVNMIISLLTLKAKLLSLLIQFILKNLALRLESTCNKNHLVIEEVFKNLNPHCLTKRKLTCI